MKRTLFVFGIISVLSMSLIACNLAQKQKDDKESATATQESYQELKEELNEVGTAITDLFETEKSDFKSKADEVLDDIDRKAEELRQKLNGAQDNETLKNKLHSLEQEADKLEKKLKELDKKSEEEWDKARKDIEKEFKKVKNEVESFFD